MADYLVTGKKGNGKSLVCVGRVRQALLAGKPVATNLDLVLSELLPHTNQSARVIRLPDKPTRADLDAIGVGNPDVANEEFNGLVVLDELATWLNARTFADKERQSVLEWFTLSRKLGWDTYLIAQNPNQVDKQVREALVEYHVVCRRIDRMKIPLLPIKFPRVHIAFVKYGMDAHSMQADKWWFRGNSLFAGYNTRQMFSSGYSDGVYSLLPPWLTHGRYSVPKPSWFSLFFAALVRGPVRPRIELKPKLPRVRSLMSLPPDHRVRLFQDLEAFA